MKATSHYVRVRYEDTVVFTEGKGTQKGRDVAEIWRWSQGIWRDHPIFHGMTTTGDHRVVERGRLVIFTDKSSFGVRA
jgi:hypothetical protein